MMTSTSNIILSTNRKSWKHSLIAYPYNDEAPKGLSYHNQKQHYKEHHSPKCSTPKYSKEKGIQQNVKDKELEVVMAAIHKFFDVNCVNQASIQGVSKTDLCNYVIQEIPRFTISKFRFALNHAIKFKLVEIDKNSFKIKIVEEDVETLGCPERISLWNNTDDEIEDIVNASIDNDKTNHRKSKQHRMKNIKCFFCNKLLYDHRGLRQHCMQSHYQAMGYRFKCNNCTHKFKTQQVLDIHFESMHGQ